MNKKKNSRPRAKVTTVQNAKPVRVKQGHYTINKLKNQAIIFFFIAIVVIALLIQVFKKAPCLETFSYTVRPGDTLWTITLRYKPDGMTMSECMAWVYENNESADIYPGDIVLMRRECEE